jgi:peptidoglycan/LPS O-acetylase OafA/YrhL
VYHYPVIWAVESALSSQPKIIQIILALLITILLSAVSYEFMEKRFINLKDKFFSRKPSAGKPANVNVPNFQS